MSNLNRNREAWVDALNILACAGVLLLHCTNSEIHDFSGQFSVGWFTGLFTHSFFIWPVNVFFMLTGYTLIRRSMLQIKTKQDLAAFYKKRCSRIVIPILFWNMVYMALFLYANRLNFGVNMNAYDVFSKFMQLQFNTTLWFFIPLITIYICLPFFAYMLLSMTREMQKCFLIIGLTIIGFTPYIISLNLNSLSNLFPLGSSYFIIAALGYYIGNHHISTHTTHLILLGSAASILLIIAGTTYLSLYVPSQYRLFINYLNYPCIVLSVGVFLFFKTKACLIFPTNSGCQTDTSVRTSSECTGGGKAVFISILHKMHSLSLGVYLIQVFIMVIIKKTIPLFQDSNYGLLLFIIMYPLCLSCTYLIKKTPILKLIV